MAEILPLTLVGNNLGERQHYLNSAVNNAYYKNVPIDLILQLPEVNSIDRIFKIQLASKYRNVDFIIKNLKDKDMLYVSKALKNMWLLESEYSHIINPQNLEICLYPEMTTTAVNKMKNFIELKLKDPERCQEFYEYYKTNFDVAIKFLWHCSKDFISEEVSNVIDKLTPKQLRLLCEACPKVAIIYFEGLQKNKLALQRYLNDQEKYCNSILNILKVDGKLFLDLIENYFDKSSLNSLNSSATRYIMKNYKKRYLAKPELYAAWFLHVKTLARFLSSEEIKDILLRLACSQFVNVSFTYKDAEPFLKCLGAEERASIKKQIFVDKSIGTKVEKWPYPAPVAIQCDNESDSEPFSDIEHDPCEYEWQDMYRGMHKRKLMKRSACGMYAIQQSMCVSKKSSLDQLFERYRFANFDKTFFELRKLLLAEGTIEGRRNMMLVLVSKAGGNEAKLEQLLKFLIQRHCNEPVHLRDAIVRSMVKRAFVWRLRSETWELLLKWATTSVPEILHITICRHLLADTVCPPADLAAYLLDFCDLTKYSLNAQEKACIAKRLPSLLISADAPEKLLDTLKAYNLHVGLVPGAEDLLITAARKDEDILQRLFKSRIARKHLLKESFRIFQTDDTYINSLKHDISTLANGESFATLVSKEKPNHDKFLHALALYFSEPDGLAVRHRLALKRVIEDECHESYARPLAFLFNSGNESFNDYIDKTDVNILEGSQRKFVAAVKANAFVVRPVIDIDTVDWHAIGSKFICNKVVLGSGTDVDENIKKCLRWKKTMRVALHLAKRNNSVTDVFAAVVRTRPTVALKFVLSDIRKGKLDHCLWNQVKPIILNYNISNKTLHYVKKALGDLNIKFNIEADYWTTVYGVFHRFSEKEAMPMLCKIENLLTEVNQELLKQIILVFLRDKLIENVFDTHDSNTLCLYFRFIAKYLLISENEHIQQDKMETVCDPFFDKIEILWHELKNRSKIIECLNDFLFALKFSRAFLDVKYVSCTLTFERILKRLRKILPREQYFENYVCIHVTMLYYRSIRQAIKQKPEVFENQTSRRNEGMRLVGFVLGKYIGIEIQELVHSFFESVIEIYQRGLVRFFRDYFPYGNSKAKLVRSVIMGLIEGGTESQLLAQHLFENERSSYDDKQESELIKLLKDVNNEEMKFFLYADINRHCM